MGLVTEIPDMKTRPMCDAEHLADAKPCPFCGLEFLNRPAGPLACAHAAGKIIDQPAMHYSEGCFLHAVTVSQMEVYLGWTERWNQRAIDPSVDNSDMQNRGDYTDD